MGLGSTEHLTEMGTRNLPGGKGRPALKAHNLAVICGSLDISQRYGPPGTLTGIAIPFNFTEVNVKNTGFRMYHRVAW
jgi:hypothetical protein